MRIVNPSFGHATAGGEQRSLHDVDWRNVPIALFSNSKPNARELLEGVRDSLKGFRDVGNIEFVSKDSVSQPAPQPVIDHIAENYGAAILAIAD